jgi:hypothetical protein
MPKRHSTRSFRVTMPPPVASLYVDNDGNPVFLGNPLDVYDESDVAVSFVAPTTGITAVVKEAVLAAIAATTPNPGVSPRSLSSIVKDAVIPKFDPKKYNAVSWINIFERECVRLKIEEDRRWEAIRLFLESGAAENWFTALQNITPNTTWEFWKNSFLKNFSKSGWNVAASAINYRYMAGSFTEYVHAKINLLTSYNPKMHYLDTMSLVVLGLPPNIQEKINPKDVSSVDDLVSIILQFEKPPSRKISDTKSSNSSSSSAFSSLRPRSSCSYCKSKGFERFHREADCFTKFKDQRDQANASRLNSNFKSKNPAVHNLDAPTLQDVAATESKN